MTGSIARARTSAGTSEVRARPQLARPKDRGHPLTGSIACRLTGARAARGLKLAMALAGALCATLAVASPAAAQSPDPATCTGYPEPRVAKEAQSWWSQGAGEANPQPNDSLNGRDEHAHIKVCVPFNTPVSGVLRLDLDMQVHEMPGGVIRKARVQDRSDTLINHDLVDETKPVCAPTGNCRYVHTVYLNTDALATGKHEFRFHNEIQRPDGARALATNGWHICIRSCSPNITQAVAPPEEEARSRWFDASTASPDDDIGYNNARLRTELPYAGGSSTPLLGLWCPTIRTLTGAGGRPVVRSVVSVDPRWHDYSVPGHPNGWPGMVVVDEPNAINRPVCIDTTRLTDGMHKLYMRADGQAATGKQGGVYVIPFFVRNGPFSLPQNPEPTPSPEPTPLPEPSPEPAPATPTVEVLDPTAGEIDPNPVSLNARATGATRMDYEVDGKIVASDTSAANGFDESVNLAVGGHSLVCIATVGSAKVRSEPRTFSVR